MIVIKEKDPIRAKSRLEDLFTNIHVGAELYIDGKRMKKPAPGFPKITSKHDGLEYGMRAEGPYLLTYPDRGISGMGKCIAGLCKHIEQVVAGRVEKMRAPVPYPRGHLYRQLGAPALNYYGDPVASYGVGVVWDFNDCLLNEDGEVCDRGEIKLRVAISPHNLSILPDIADCAAINYLFDGDRPHKLVMMRDIPLKKTLVTENLWCGDCSHIIIGTVCYKDGLPFCVRCCNVNADFVADMSRALIESNIAEHRHAKMLADMRAAKKETIDGIVCFVGQDYVFSVNARAIAYGEPRFAGKTAVHVYICKVV